MAVVGLEKMHFHGPHGFYPEEEILGNEFMIDLYVEAETTQAGMMDDLEKTVNYETLYLIVQAEMRKSAQLIEALGERILDRIEEFYEPEDEDDLGVIQGVRVVIRKLNPPLTGPVGAAYIELKRGSFGGGGRGPRGKLSSILGKL